jgi:SPP1 gp7 family putative phage head morphogenesis protein
MLKQQIEAAIEKLHSDEYNTIQDYLNDTYTDSFVGAIYDMHGQGVPVIVPIDHNAAIKAVMLDTKLNKPLYDSLGVDINKLKKTISQEISRGLASGMMYSEISRNIHLHASVPMKRAKTIVRTEVHRIHEASADDARHKAKSKGADVVKQWDATLDGDTRKSHRKLDGQIRELDEPFEVNGKKVMHPGGFGRPEEDINCRCALLQRARWALDDKELQTLKERADFFELYKKDEFEEFKKKYLKALETLKKQEENGTIKLSINLFDKSDALFLDALSIEKEPGFEDVCSHG